MSRTVQSPVKRRARSGCIRRTAAAALCVAVAACGDRGARDQAPDAAGPPSYGGTLVIASPSDLDAANGLVSREVRTNDLIRNALFMTLLRYGQTLDYEPYLAQSWEMLGDTGVVFHLRDDVRWHDGEPTTAYDVAFTYERARDPATGFANQDYFAHWGAVEVVDSFTVRFDFEPHADPLAGLPYFPIMPRHLLDSVPAAQLRQAAFNRNPVGNGPFRFVSQRANDRWIFEANPDFPEALGGRPYLDRIVWRVIPERASQVAEIRAGTVDLILSPGGDQLEALDARPSLRMIVRPTRKYQLLGWNGLRPPLDDARVRRALSLAIDRGEMLQALRNGYGSLAIGPIDPSNWAYHHGLDPLPYDTAAARALLTEAGFEDRDGDGVLEDDAGKDFEITLSIPANNEYNRNVAEKVQSDLRAVGVALSIRPLDFATFVADFTSPERRFDGIVLGWEGDFRPSTLRDMFHSKALGGAYQLASYHNATVDSLIDEASRLEDRDAASPLWYRIQEILRDEQPWTFLYYTPDLYVMNERLRGVEMDVRGMFDALPRWWKVAGDSATAAARASR